MYTLSNRLEAPVSHSNPTTLHSKEYLINDIPEKPSLPSFTCGVSLGSAHNPDWPIRMLYGSVTPIGPGIGT